MTAPCSICCACASLSRNRARPRASTRSLGAPENYAAMMSRGGFMGECAILGIAVPETISLPTAIRSRMRRWSDRPARRAESGWKLGRRGRRHRPHPRGSARRLAETFAAGLRVAQSCARGVAQRCPSSAGVLTKPAAARDHHAGFHSRSPATTAFACWKGDVVGTIHMDVVASSCATGPASVAKRVDCADMEAAARAIARRFDLSGLHGLDFIRNAQGKAYLLEINPRATQTSYLAFGPGRDLLAGLLERASGAHCRARTPATANHSHRALSAGMGARSRKSPSQIGLPRHSVGRSRSVARLACRHPAAQAARRATGASSRQETRLRHGNHRLLTCRHVSLDAQDVWRFGGSGLGGRAFGARRRNGRLRARNAGARARRRRLAHRPQQAQALSHPAGKLVLTNSQFPRG